MGKACPTNKEIVPLSPITKVPLYQNKYTESHNSVNANVDVNLHSAFSHSASNAFDAPKTAGTSASSIGDRIW